MMKRLITTFLTFLLFTAPVCCEQKFDNYKPDVEGEIAKRLNIEPVYVSLDECLNIAIVYNYEIKSSIATLEQKDWEFKNSLTAFLPEAGFTGFITKYAGQLLVGAAVIDDLNEIALFAGGYITHDLTQGGRTVFEAVKRKNLQKAEGFRTRLKGREILYRTAIQYYKLLESKLIMENYLINLYDRQYQYEIAKARYDVGAGEKFDVLRTDIERKQAEENVLNTLLEFKVNQAQLSNVMGVGITSPLMPVECNISEYKLVEDNDNVETLFQIALQQSSVIKSLEKDIAALKNEKNSYYSDFIPKIDLMVQQSYQGTKRQGVAPNTILRLNADIPIGDNLGIGTLSKIKIMQKQIRVKELDLEQAKRDIKEQIVSAYSTSDFSEAKIKIISKELELSEMSAKIATGKYFEGEGILLDVIQAQTKKTQINTELYRTKIKYNTSQLELLYRSGLVTVANILKGYNP